MAKVKKTKVPFTTVSGDDYSVVIGEETYYPHAGETVTFKRGMSPEDYGVLIAFKSMAALAQQRGDDIDVVAMVNDINKVVEVLANGIKSWTWTDADDNPLPAPTVEVLSTVDLEEIIWMVSKRLGARSEAETKND